MCVYVQMYGLQMGRTNTGQPGDEKCDQLWLLNGSQMGLEERGQKADGPCENIHSGD